MHETRYVNDKEFYVFQKGDLTVEVNGPINIAHTLKISFTNEKEKKEEVKFSLPTGQLKELGGMLIRAAELSEAKAERTEDEAYLIMGMDLPIEYILAHLKKVYNSDKNHGEYLRNKFLELLDYEVDRDYDNDKIIYWFNQLTKVFHEEYLANIDSSNSKHNTNATQVSNEYFEEFSEDYESESDYWKRNAEDSDMTLEEYFNSMD